MGLFSRRRRPDADEPNPSGPRDDELTMLSRDQAAALFRMVREEAAGLGREIAVVDGVMTLDSGEVLGLHNLAASLVHQPYRTWRPAVANHVRILLENFARPFEVAHDRQVFAKLRRADSLPREPDYQPWEPLPGVLALVAIDHPDQVTELMGGLAEVEGDLDSAYAHALANLTALPAPYHEQVAPPESPDAVVHVFFADDFFGASRVLVLGQVLEAAGVAFPEHGVLLAVPNRHMLAVHVPRDASVIAAAQLLTSIAMSQFDDQPGPISPFVYHLRPDGAATQFSSLEDGAIRLTVDGPIAEMFEHLGLSEP